MCKLHNKRKKYLCFTCMKLFCSNCLILEKHDQSHFLLDTRSQGKEEDFSSMLLVTQPLIHFSDFLSEDYITQIKEKIEALEKSKTRQLTYLKNYTAALTKLFDETIEKLNKQIENYLYFSEQFQKGFSDLKTSINELLSIGAPPAKVKDIHFEVLKFLEQKQKDISPLYACISPKPLGFTYNKISFTIINCRDIIKNKYPEKEDIYSPIYSVDFLSFNFLINPYGYGENAKNKYMSVFLGLKEGNKGEIYNFDYKFEMVNFKGEKNFEKSFVSSNFESGGTSWGCFQFYKLDELESKGFIDEEGNVVLNCYIKPSTEEDIRKAFEYYYVNKMKMPLPFQ